MTNQQKTIIAIVVVILIVGLLWWRNNQSKPSNTNEPIKIGAIQPLTGDANVWGIPEKNSIELAIAEINDHGGINGRPIVVTYEDGKCASKDAVAAANKLVGQGVKIIITSCDAETLSVAPIAESNHIILFTPYGSNPAITQAGDYVFRNSYSDSDVARIAAKTIAQQYKKVGMLYEVTDYPVGLKNAFKASFEQQGGQMIEEGYPQNSKDMRTQITKLLGQNVDAIFLNPNTPATGVAALQQLQALGFKGQLYGNYAGSSSEIINSPAAEGMIFFSDPTIAESPLKKDFFAKYEQHYGAKPDLEYPAVASYDAMQIFKKALEQSGDNPDKLKQYLYDMPEYTGALGTYHFDNNGDVVGISPSLKQIKNRQVIQLPN